eukprot:m.471410 g.471410  ORF g.471410 m.471410 type:complete len:939 (+) comp57102_c0_seq1:293-3109(+)
MAFTRILVGQEGLYAVPTNHAVVVLQTDTYVPSQASEHVLVKVTVNALQTYRPQTKSAVSSNGLFNYSLNVLAPTQKDYVRVLKLEDASTGVIKNFNGQVKEVVSNPSLPVVACLDSHTLKVFNTSVPSASALIYELPLQVQAGFLAWETLEYLLVTVTDFEIARIDLTATISSALSGGSEVPFSSVHVRSIIRLDKELASEIVDFAFGPASLNAPSVVALGHRNGSISIFEEFQPVGSAFVPFSEAAGSLRLQFVAASSPSGETQRLLLVQDLSHSRLSLWETKTWSIVQQIAIVREDNSPAALVSTFVDDCSTCFLGESNGGTNLYALPLQAPADPSVSNGNAFFGSITKFAMVTKFYAMTSDPSYSMVAAEHDGDHSLSARMFAILATKACELQVFFDSAVSDPQAHQQHVIATPGPVTRQAAVVPVRVTNTTPAVAAVATVAFTPPVGPIPVVSPPVVPATTESAASASVEDAVPLTKASSKSDPKANKKSKSRDPSSPPLEAVAAPVPKSKKGKGPAAEAKVPVNGASAASTTAPAVEDLAEIKGGDLESLVSRLHQRLAKLQDSLAALQQNFEMANEKQAKQQAEALELSRRKVADDEFKKHQRLLEAIHSETHATIDQKLNLIVQSEMQKMTAKIISEVQGIVPTQPTAVPFAQELKQLLSQNVTAFRAEMTRAFSDQFKEVLLPGFQSALTTMSRQLFDALTRATSEFVGEIQKTRLETTHQNQAQLDDLKAFVTKTLAQTQHTVVSAIESNMTKLGDSFSASLSKGPRLSPAELRAQTDEALAQSDFNLAFHTGLTHGNLPFLEQLVAQADRQHKALRKAQYSQSTLLSLLRFISDTIAENWGVKLRTLNWCLNKVDVTPQQLQPVLIEMLQKAKQGIDALIEASERSSEQRLSEQGTAEQGTSEDNLLYSTSDLVNLRLEQLTAKQES